MHDTEIDGYDGEAVRCGGEGGPAGVAARTGYPLAGVARGLKPAIFDFLVAHLDEWALHAHYPNCYGLTVLKRKA